MDDNQEILQLEIFAKDLFQLTDRNSRIEAEKALVQFTYTPNCLKNCFLLLERKTSEYSRILATTALNKLIFGSNCSLTVDQRREIQKYCLTYLATNSDLETYVSQSLSQLYCQITKVGWFESAAFHNVMSDVNPLVSSGEPHQMSVGIQVLSQLAVEMNQSQEGKSSGKQGKVSSSFRDLLLFDFFQLGCSLLQNAVNMMGALNLSDSKQMNVLSNSLELVKNCLLFDFIGVSSDESGDDSCTVQLPTAWKTVFLDGSIVRMLFNLLSSVPPLSRTVLICLVQIASIRRSLFSNIERARFLNELVTGIKQILLNPHKFTDENMYHEVCRLLARLKGNFQLSELVKVENYSDLIKILAEFTLSCFRLINFPANSSFYLLCFWQKMVAPIPYVKTSDPHHLEVYAPEVFRAFVVGQHEYVRVNLSNNFEEPLEDQTVLSQQLEQLATIGRYEYQKSCNFIAEMLDEALRDFSRALDQPNLVKVSEGCLAWLVFVVGSVVGGRVAFASTEKHDELDGELVCRVLKIISETDFRLPQQMFPKLELSYLAFLEQFKKIYIGDQVQKTSRVYKCLSEVLGINDETMMLSVVIRKIITNIKFWSYSEPVMHKSLQLLNDLSIGYSSLRKIVKLEEIHFLLENHTGECFAFLDTSSASKLEIMKCRTTFYKAITRLLVADLGEDEERFDAFMKPLRRSFDKLEQLMMYDSLNTDKFKKLIIGLARDLTGIAFSLNSRINFTMFYNWFFPRYSCAMTKALDMFHFDPAVTTPVLRLYQEMAHNRSQRLQFDVSSPNGILLFREISKVIVCYGSHLLNKVDIPEDKLYPLKLKGISICFYILKLALSGNYVNFGVFKLYGDPALNNVLEMFIKLLLSAGLKEIMSYPKLTLSYYALLESLAQDHLCFVSRLEPNILLYLLSTVSEGLSSLDSVVITSCCASLDNIMTHIYKVYTKKIRPGEVADENTLVKLHSADPNAFRQILSTILNAVIFEECRNQWSMTRPLFSLILLNEEYYNSLKQEIVQSYSSEKQSAVAQSLDNIMDGVEKNLLTKNRDRFTHNLTVLRHEISNIMKREVFANNSMF